MTKRISRNVVRRLALKAIQQGGGVRPNRRWKLLRAAETIQEISPAAWRTSKTCGCLVGIAYNLPLGTFGPDDPQLDAIGARFDWLLREHVGESYDFLDKLVVV